MKTLYIAGKMTSPEVDFNPETGLLKMMGRSIPENPVKFYQPIENWLIDFVASKPKIITLFVELDYLNTHSTECVLILMKILQGYYTALEENVKVIWNFDRDDEDMETLGQDLAAITQIPFEFNEIVDED